MPFLELPTNVDLIEIPGIGEILAFVRGPPNGFIALLGGAFSGMVGWRRSGGGAWAVTEETVGSEGDGHSSAGLLVGEI